MELVLYERAKTALAAAHRVDEVKEIRDRAEAAAAYARQAKDSQMIAWATEIKVRAERRAGELMAKLQREQGTRSDLVRPADKVRSEYAETLEQTGVTRQTAHRWQQLAAMPDEHFETAVATAKHVSNEVSSEFVRRQYKEGSDDVIVGKRRASGPKTEAAKQRLEALRASGQQTYTAGAMRACLRAVREYPDDAAAEIELIEELMAELAAVVETAHAGLSEAA
jgi:hypothetical protein